MIWKRLERNRLGRYFDMTAVMVREALAPPVCSSPLGRSHFKLTGQSAAGIQWMIETP